MSEFYPFLDAPRSATLDGVLAAVRRSTLDKAREVISLRCELAAEYSESLVHAANLMGRRFEAGGKLIAFGNGGSATDADDMVADCLTPPRPAWRSLPAISLPADSATLSGVANDVGFEHVFRRQLIALAQKDDIAIRISTSGNSPNVAAALVEAKRRGMLTIALAGYDGGAIAREGSTDFCFVARREFVPRIQEGHATLWHALLELVHAALGEDET